MTIVAAERAGEILAAEKNPGTAMALRIVLEAARLCGATHLVGIASAHIDGCLYHGDSGVHFNERLVALGARTAVPTTLNVGALDLLHPNLVRLDGHRQAMAKRLMDAHLKLGCAATWTCAPYQAGHRPKRGAHVAWGESNAVAFANSVLGARTDRYGDFLDISAAIAGYAPYSGLHVDANRRAGLVVDVTGLSPSLLAEAAFYPVLGFWLGGEAGSAVPAILGLPRDLGEDALKALGAAAAASGAVGLFHVVGVTPEAPDLETACHGAIPRRRIRLTGDMVRQARDRLDTAASDQLDCIALGSPHFSFDETRRLLRHAAGRRFRIPVYVCTGRNVLGRLEAAGLIGELERLGVELVVDTCVIVTPILKDLHGVMMTNAAKFAHYGKGNTGYDTVFGGLSDCVESAVAGRLVRDQSKWA